MKIKLTPVPSAFIGIWLIRFDASNGGFAGGGTVVGGAGVVIGKREPSWKFLTNLICVLYQIIYHY